MKICIFCMQFVCGPYQSTSHPKSQYYNPIFMIIIMSTYIIQNIDIIVVEYGTLEYMVLICFLISVFAKIYDQSAYLCLS